MTKKEKILASCNSIPTASLVNYLNEGEVTLAELRDAGLTSEKEDEVQKHIAANEQVMWRSAKKKDTPQAYSEFLVLFPEGEYANECKSCLSDKEEGWWDDIKLTPTVDSINKYLEVFPLGHYAIDAQNLLQDMPWLETCKIGTEAAYLEYKNSYPDQHSAEIKSILNGFRDDGDWSMASRQNTTEAYQDYLHQHRYGKHSKDAQKIIDERSLHDNMLNGLKANKNAFSAEDIKKAVGDNTVTEREICDILGDKWVYEIMNYTRPVDLPILNDSVPELEKGRTEVYFWGTPASGKTCTLGAVLSRAESKGLLRKRSGAIMYLDALKNIFKKSGVNRLPNSTSNTCIYNMGVDLKDSDGRSHAITMIDIAGEIFKWIYYDSLGILKEDDVRKSILNTTFNYLKDKRNKKIMFFVVEYNGHNRVWDDDTSLTMSDYLNRCAEYLNDKKIISSSVNGIYVLVTKSDMIECEYKELPIKAKEYVEEYFFGFWETLKDICKKAGVKDLKVIPFSVGNVVAKQLCEFDGKYAKLVLDRICDKSDSTGNSIWDFFRG